MKDTLARTSRKNKSFERIINNIYNYNIFVIFPIFPYVPSECTVSANALQHRSMLTRADALERSKWSKI